MIYLLYGEDTFRSLTRVNEIISRARSLYKEQLNLRRIDAGEDNIRVIEHELETPSLFTPFRLIVVNNASNEKNIYEYLESLIGKFKLDKSTDNIVVFHEGKLENKSQLPALLKTHGKVQEFAFLKRDKITLWIKKFFAARGIKITPEALVFLINTIGPDLWMLSNECHKLASWSGANKETITLSIVEEITPASIDSGVFPFVDYFLGKNKQRALYELEMLAAKGEDVNGLFYLLVKQFEYLAQLFALNQAGRLPLNTAKILGAHPYVVNKLSAQLKRWPQAEIGAVFERLANYDLAIKTGAFDARLALTLLVAAT
ncbi:MAG: DNA polymerase III subunit delta [Candidatus Terrybacteria bacterium RIFCSPLOWO2_01_FULL_44_24]|uniref:DNA polymerase III subunit delta n=1 Tax=Candidatus Terrybacteria bacterium RIFCSPHIGHO2_01_FULL_43_35 TaxID=1802361 RepID=A0A1G2PE85_9BACT|nr:MAG: DNA polymerase III subunit delta [Candidatus Terrybacteria bacterium RIFCSPHIGHO2_01_FULL_43_35]OHA50886.1 MAG: DNA polymerase III subunit delta [Candidatus Terrybacteria bacterium RIFCSPLOWO2_01_FULL_44_24]